MDAIKNRKRRLIQFVSIVIVATVVLSILSLLLGSTKISFQTVWDALFHFDPENHQQIAIVELRLPRTIAGLLCGSALACSGALMQGMSRNPLADAGLLGINSGAAFALAIILAIVPSVTFPMTILASFIGASVSVFLLMGILRLSGHRMNPLRLVLAGSALSILFSSLSSGLAMFAHIGQEVTFWSAGGMAGVRLSQLPLASIVILCGLVCAWLLSSRVSLLSLGEESARGLGVPVESTVLLVMIVVLVLAGVSVALAGPIGFVGLLVPHFVRYFVGGNYRVIIPCSMLAGAMFMVGADLISRLINAPAETPIGLIFALVGVPVFIAVVRKGGSEFD